MEVKDLDNNKFLRQFELSKGNVMARIEYAEQERKIFLTKLIVPKEIDSLDFKNKFISLVLDYVSEKKYESCSYQSTYC